MRVVVDTNVLVSGMINAIGTPGRIVDLIRSSALELVVDDRILSEYIDVLNRDSLKKYFAVSDRENIIDFLKHNSYYTTSKAVILDLPDKDDCPFLEIALTESIPLITGNVRHYPKDKRQSASVVTPTIFFQQYFPIL